MSGVRTFHPDPTWTAERALCDKGSQRIAVCIPCRNEETTIGALVTQIRTALVDAVPLVDELVVLDDSSSDATAAVAAVAGARVLPVDAVTACVGERPGRGKGNVLWASVVATEADIIVWCDADLTSFSPDWIVRLVLPLLLEPDVAIVKADYARPTDAGGGGRTTELMARPLLSLYFPDLAALAQPLGGEMAVRRAVVEQIPFVTGWGVEVGLLVDIARSAGIGSVAQVDLGVRRHRHRPLAELAVQAAEVGATILGRAGVLPIPDGEAPPALRRADGSLVRLTLAERPPPGQARPRMPHD